MDLTKIPQFVAFWEGYAAAFAQPLQANGMVSRFVTNPAVTGDYAEAWIRDLANRMLGLRFRISTGAVIRQSDAERGLRSVPQCDLIIWNPSELPALFEVGDFALVPFHSVQAVIEIKRVWNKDMPEQLGRLKKVVPSGAAFGVVVSHSEPLFKPPVTPNWLSEWSTQEPAATRLLDKDDNPDTHGILAFVYFLAQIAGNAATIAPTQLRTPKSNRAVSRRRK